MISCREALKEIYRHIPAPQGVRMGLESALGCVIAKDILSPIPMPPADQSSVNGFAFRARDTRRAKDAAPVMFEVVRGDGSAALHPGSAVWVAKGAALPSGADAAAAKDAVEFDGRFLVIRRAFAVGENICRCGTEIRRGAIAAKRGTVIHAGVVGFLAGLGFNAVMAYRRPKVRLLVAEQPGIRQDTPGSVIAHDGSGPMIACALREAGAFLEARTRLKGHPVADQEALAEAFAESDMVVVAGSDFAREDDSLRKALAALGVRQVFEKVSQKPGKPLYFGTRDKKLVFGLPAQAAGALVCFYEYVYPAILRWMGRADALLPAEEAPLEKMIWNPSDRTLFLKCRIISKHDRRLVRILPHQDAHGLFSLCQASGFAMIRPGATRSAGEKIFVRKFPAAGIP